LASANEEIGHLQKLHRDALAELSDARGRIAALEARPAAMWAAFSRAYLAATAPDETGLRALQVSVNRSRLLERCDELRKAVRDQSTRELLDRAEVVLTRLVMMDPAAPGAMDSFASLVRQSGIMADLDQALGAQAVPTAVWGWLMEARVILGGADRVG
jgi:hypothetical protein